MQIRSSVVSASFIVTNGALEGGKKHRRSDDGGQDPRCSDGDGQSGDGEQRAAGLPAR